MTKKKWTKIIPHITNNTVMIVDILAFPLPSPG